MTNYSAVPPRNANSSASELWLSAAEKRLNTLLVVLAHARQRKLVDVHVTGEIVERMRQAVDRQLGHRDRQRRLGGHLRGQRHRGVEGLAGIGHLLHQTPLVGLGG